jgi:hypothetical protein
MPRPILLLALAVALALSLGRPAPVVAQDAQSWRPASTAMPAMIRYADLQTNWRAGSERWLSGTEQASGVRVADMSATGDRNPASDLCQVVRFGRGPVPAVVWTDRNGDGRADLVEIMRSGTVLYQLIDVDHSGSADVLRIYDANGRLVREERL